MKPLSQKDRKQISRFLGNQMRKQRLGFITVTPEITWDLVIEQKGHRKVIGFRFLETSNVLMKRGYFHSSETFKYYCIRAALALTLVVT